MTPDSILRRQRDLVERLRREAIEAQKRLDRAIAEEAAMLKLWHAVEQSHRVSPGPAGSSAESVASARLLGNEPPKPRTGGRTKGSINLEWREVLRHCYGRGIFSYSEIGDKFTEITGETAPLGSIRDRVRALVRMGFMSGDKLTGFQVTEEAAVRFGFHENEGPGEPGPSNGDVAEWFNASDSKSDGAN